jgi:plasmid maintenance system antidote protein VapI
LIESRKVCSSQLTEKLAKSLKMRLVVWLLLQNKIMTLHDLEKDRERERRQRENCRDKYRQQYMLK